MIKLLRIDERLIHGQVANQWARQLGVDAIVVANDEASKNDLVKMSLHMAAPQGVKVAVVTIEKAIAQLNDPRSAPLTIFIVVNAPEDALKIVKNVQNIPYVNIGNFGRINREKMNRKRFADNLYANDQEIQALKDLLHTGIDCEYRVLSSDPKIEVSALIQ